MALSVQISTNSTPNITYALQTDDITLDYTRGPLQVPISGRDPHLMDLGFFRPSVILSGVVKQDATETDGGISIPDKRDLEDFVEGTSGTPAIYSSTITLAVTFDSQTDNYVGKISKCTFTRREGQTVWDFKMTVLAQGRS